LAISGINTNLDLHKVIVESKEFRKGDLTTDFLSRNNINKDLRDLERKKLAAVFQLVKELNFSFQSPNQITTKSSNKWRDSAKIDQVR
jgi:acetyl/propionyl-CoA carboxylase alpha subunit